jgi:enoyl-CoA hydratase
MSMISIHCFETTFQYLWQEEEITVAELATYALQGPVATITIDDEKVNAFSIPMLRAIHAALDRAEYDRSVVLLTGREGCFSAGFDLNVLAEGGDQVLEMLRLGANLCERVLSFARPVIVACTGHALAAGTFLTLAADLRIGVRGPFRIGLNEVQIGLTVPWFAIELARQRLHPAHFDRAVVGAEIYGPDEALAAGFLERVVPVEELREVSLQAATRLSKLDAQAHAATKLRARAGALELLRSAIQTELNAGNLDGAHARS